MKKALYLLLFLLVCFSCKKQDNKIIKVPTFDMVYFTPLSSNQYVPTLATITFNITSGDTYDKVQWDFGDGILKEANNDKVYHSYKEKGTYQVKLKVWKGSENKEFNQKIEVRDRKIDFVEVGKLDLSLLTYPKIEDLSTIGNAPIKLFFRVYGISKDVNFVTLLTPQGIQNAEILYQSASVPAVDISNFIISNTVFNIKNDNIDVLPPDINKTQGYCVYAEINHKEYLLATNWYLYIYNFDEDYRSRTYKYTIFNLGNYFSINGKY